MPIQVLKDPPSPEGRLLLISGYEERFYAAVKELPLFVEEEMDAREALAHAHEWTYGVVMTGMNMGEINGMQMLDAVLTVDPDTPVIVSTHETSPKVIVEAMRRGAFDYVIEPHDIPEVIAVIRRAVAHRKTLEAARDVRSTIEAHRHFEDLIGTSEPFQEVCRQVRQVAPTGSPVLLTGESGTGKELLAQAIHRDSPRRERPFVAVNCASLTETLLESELFGHEKGAFTGAVARHAGMFEKADSGTLFLDEIGATSLSFQVRLLRAIESGSIRRVGGEEDIRVDVRIVSATNKPLDGLVREGKFREDLLYRLNVVTIEAPPLRNRRADIPLLAQHFLDRAAVEAGKGVAAISSAAMQALMRHPFPGNVRELRNAIEHAVVMCRGRIIGPDDLPRALAVAQPIEAALPSKVPLPERIEAFERRLIQESLAQHDGNRSAAAKALGLKRTTLVKKLKRFGLT